ncbi:MAG: LLM class flavin-dependent oxidoreductase [Candidatus Thorarchaeota archaeon]
MMRWGLGVNVMQTVTETIQTCIIAEKGGIDQLWIIDFPSPYHAFGLASNIAMETKTRIGIGLVSPLLYRPTQIAQAIETLVEHFGNRFELLVGVGDRQQLGNIGVEYGDIGTLVSRVLNSIHEIKSVLGEKSIECPILLGAQGPKMIKASTETDGVLLNFTDPLMIEWALQILSERSKDFKVGVFPPTSVSTDSATSPSIEFKFSAAVVALGINQTIRKKFGFEPSLSELKAITRKKGKLTMNIVDKIEDKTLGRFGLHATPEGITDYVQKLETIGVDHIVFGPPLNQMRVGLTALLKAR